jgi:fumarate hydratase subunit alpha
MATRNIQCRLITETVARLFVEANLHLPDDVLKTIRTCKESEESQVGSEILGSILENANIAAKERLPLCQDTGVAVVFVEIGQEVHVMDGDLNEAIHGGVRQGTKDGYLRRSMVADPLRRTNTGDNTPAVIYVNVVPGDKIKLTVLAKGGGAENMSRIAMLTPYEGIEGVRKIIVETVRLAGANPCPPVIIGVGIGGTFDLSPLLAKKALLRNLGERHPDPFYANLEVELLKEINELGIGPQGLGGSCTALDVLIEVSPCHIASLPVAVNIQCHSARHKSAVI